MADRKNLSTATVALENDSMALEFVLYTSDFSVQINDGGDASVFGKGKLVSIQQTRERAFEEFVDFIEREVVERPQRFIDIEKVYSRIRSERERWKNR